MSALILWHIYVFAPFALLAALIGVAALFVRARRRRVRGARPGAHHPTESHNPDADHQ